MSEGLIGRALEFFADLLSFRVIHVPADNFARGIIVRLDSGRALESFHLNKAISERRIKS